MKPTEILKHEHQAIKTAISILENVSGRLKRGEKVDPAHLSGLVEFIKVFADRCHHGKEEDLLFREMAATGMPVEGGPIGVMLHEHDVGRGFVRGMDKAAKEYATTGNGAGAVFSANARNYGALLRGHVDKEDGILYPMADAMLTARQEAKLLEGFERVENERVGAGRHEQFHEFLGKLKGIYL